MITFCFVFDSISVCSAKFNHSFAYSLAKPIELKVFSAFKRTIILKRDARKNEMAMSMYKLNPLQTNTNLFKFNRH